MTEETDARPKAVPKNRKRNEPVYHNRNFFIVLTMIIILFFLIARPFLVPLLMGFIVAGVSRPLYLFFLRLTRKKPSLSSLLSILTFVICFVLPLVLVGIQVVKQGIAIIQSALGNIEVWAQKMSVLQGKMAKLLPFLHLEKGNWGELVNNSLKEFLGGGLALLNQGLQGAGSFLLSGFVFLFSLHYFYIDWKRVLNWLVQLSPLAPAHIEKVSRRFVTTSRSVLRTMLIIGVLQGILGGCAFALAGIPAPIFWGFVMVLFSLLPVIGTGLIWLPAALIKLFSGQLVSGIIILAFGVVVVGGLENLVRPKLVGGQAALHPLPVFIATMGGIAFFGISGFILGPLVVAILAVMLDIYREEIRPQA